jgi:hypothetical protein
MIRPGIYHIAVLLLTLFWTGILTPALALEKKKIVDVWPVGQKQQYFYYLNGQLAGESWMEIREVPRTKDRYEMVNTIDVDGVPFGSRMKITGQAIAELDPWGRPISYDLELKRPQGVTTLTAFFNHPIAELRIAQPDSVYETHPQYNEESLILDFVFIGPFDLAFRLDPVHPAAKSIRRNYFVPQLEVNVLTDYQIVHEEVLTLDDDTTVSTVKVDLHALLTHVWLDPDGRVVKAEVPSERLEIRLGETIAP